jgi:hypothetical protein
MWFWVLKRIAVPNYSFPVAFGMSHHGSSYAAEQVSGCIDGGTATIIPKHRKSKYDEAHDVFMEPKPIFLIMARVKLW